MHLEDRKSRKDEKIQSAEAMEHDGRYCLADETEAILSISSIAGAQRTLS
jgi:hypothetical protein